MNVVFRIWGKGGLTSEEFCFRHAIKAAKAGKDVEVETHEHQRKPNCGDCVPKRGRAR